MALEIELWFSLTENKYGVGMQTWWCDVIKNLHVASILKVTSWS